MRALPAFRPLSVLVALTAGLASSTALAGDPETPDELMSIEDSPEIYGGTSVGYCGWPTTIYLDFGAWVCSGTLVHKDIVITAAHCPDTPNGRNATVRFGEKNGGGERTVNSTCYSNPGYNGNIGTNDYAYCKLDSSVTDIPIIPPAFGCEVSAITAGREVVLVGFGNSDNGGSGSKREVTTTINTISTEAFIGGMGKDTCQGDSGGPVYIQLKSEFGGDDTWRAFGITSGGGACGGGGYYALMHVAIPWIEQHSGVDITPCHNVDGTWAPTPACGGIPYDPANGVGNWATGCSDGSVSAFSGLCGTPFGDDDEDPPTVTITAPADGTYYDSSPADVMVTATAEDIGYGVSNVRLLINGDEFANNVDGAAPWEWPLVLPDGAWTIQAVATDWSGNEGVSEIIGIGVNADPPNTNGDTDTGTDGNADEVGTLDGTGGDLGADDRGGTEGCACTAGDEQDRRGGLAVTALLGLGLLGLRRRRG